LLQLLLKMMVLLLLLLLLLSCLHEGLQVCVHDGHSHKRMPKLMMERWLKVLLLLLLRLLLWLRRERRLGQRLKVVPGGKGHTGEGI